MSWLPSAALFESLAQRGNLLRKLHAACLRLLRLSSQFLNPLIRQLANCVWVENGWQVADDASLDGDVDDIVGERAAGHLEAKARVS